MKYITTPEQAFIELAPLVKTKRQIAALRVLGEKIEMSENKDKEAHWLFGKLWLYMFDKNLIHYESSQGAINSIRMALTEPMDNYFKYIKLTFGDKLDEAEIRKTLADKINLMLDDKNFYN